MHFERSIERSYLWRVSLRSKESSRGVLLGTSSESTMRQGENRPNRDVQPADIAQLDRASGFEPEGRGFKSLCSHHKYSCITQEFLFACAASNIVSHEKFLCYTLRNMSMLLLVGIVLAGVPTLLIVGFAAYIFFGFVNDDKDARAVLNVALMVIGVGILLILGDVLTNVFIVK